MQEAEPQQSLVALKLEQLGLLNERRKALEDQLAAVKAEEAEVAFVLRMHRTTWQEIADVLEVSHSAAHQRFATYVVARQVELVSPKATEDPETRTADEH